MSRGQEEAAAFEPLDVLDDEEVDDEEVDDEDEDEVEEEGVAGAEVEDGDDDVDSVLEDESLVFPFAFSALVPRESLR
jgi:hypothetical protein